METQENTGIRFDRLIQIAEHLESGKLAHEEFNFNYINVDADRGSPIDGMCGTLGCAMGEFPAIWPDDWRWLGDKVGLADSPNIDWEDLDVMAWLGIDHYALGHLFWPGLQSPDRCGGRHLPLNATKDEVAANIRAFIEKMGGGK